MLAKTSTPDEVLPPRYSLKELKEIDAFLSQSFHKLYSDQKFVLPYDPQAASNAVSGETGRLRKKHQRAAEKLTARDAQELVESINGPFSEEQPHVRSKAIADFEQANAIEPGRPLAQLLLKHFLNKLCGKHAIHLGPAPILITSAGLAEVFRQLALPIVFAPVCVWLLTIIRDVGLPALCEALQEYLAGARNSP
jgi:hypothetical protein